MEEAKITQIGEPEQKSQDQSMYQQGRFPSVVDTDDLVFELGKQVVDRINKEKLLENILKKAKVLEVGAAEVKKLQIEAEKKAIELKSSNRLYEENNYKLDKELVSVRDGLENQKREVVKVKSELDEQRCIYEENEKKLNEEISSLKNNSSKPKKKTRKKTLKG